MDGLDQLAGGLDASGALGTVAGGAVAVAAGAELGDALRLVAQDVLLSMLPIYAAAPVLGLAVNGIRAALGDEKKTPALGFLLGASSVGEANGIQLALTRLAAVRAGYVVEDRDLPFLGSPTTAAPAETWDWIALISKKLAEAFDAGEGPFRQALRGPFNLMLFHGAQELWDEHKAKGLGIGTIPEPVDPPTKKRRKVLDRLGVPRYFEYVDAAAIAKEVEAEAKLLAAGTSSAQGVVGQVGGFLEETVSAVGSALDSLGGTGGAPSPQAPHAAPAGASSASAPAGAFGLSTTTLLLLAGLVVLALLVATAK